MANDLMKIDYEDRKAIETIKNTVAQGLTSEEFSLFIQYCKSTGLNCFKKEIWGIKAGGRLQIMTGIAGFLAIANAHAQYDGMELETIEENGKPIKAICKVYRKDRKFPSVGIALMSEFRKSTPIWNQMPSVMLSKCAKSIALREAFPQELNGLYTAEEMPVEFSASAQVVKEPQKAVFKSEEGNKIAKTMNAIDDGSAIGYDIPKMTGKKREEFKDIFRAFGCVAKDGITYCYREIPEWSEYLVLASKETTLEEDELPSEWDYEEEEKAFLSAKEKEGANI